jgi:DASS family divalent anion:Na+ symporter
MYLTGMAPNPIVTSKANELFGINFDFMTWLKGSIVPALICAICLPLILRWSLGMNKKQEKSAKNGDDIIQHAQMELNKMGAVSKKEWV